MNKKQAKTGGIILLVGFSIATYLLVPRESICADQIRGYQQQASSSFNALREKYASLSSSVEVGDSFEVPQLDGLNSENFSALKACDVHCKLLEKCLRLVFFEPPSTACPTEYSDYKEATENASNVFAKLASLENAADHTVAKAQQLANVRKDIVDLESMSGSTGGRMAVLNARAAGLEREVSQDLSDMNLALIDISANLNGPIMR